MISTEEVKKLAALARIEVNEKETEALAHDIEAILGYVGQVQNMSLHERTGDACAPMNVFRADGEPHAAGSCTEALRKAAPETEDGFVRVKKVL